MHAIKAIGRKIIAFVAQIENFQKRLFEKRKFVTEVNYCVTLDRVPEELYPEIAKNTAQTEEWKELFQIQEIKGDLVEPGFTEPLKIEFLKSNKTLLLDTRFFSNDFKDRLLDSTKDLDATCDGLLIHSDNFQALRLIEARFREQVKCEVHRSTLQHQRELDSVQERLQTLLLGHAHAGSPSNHGPTPSRGWRYLRKHRQT